jgi:hypothetical protein
MSDNGAGLSDAVITLIGTLVVAVISAGVSIFTLFRSQKDSKLLREKDQEHEKHLQQSNHKHDERLRELETRDQRELERLRSNLEVKVAEQKARSDYVYEAKKKLYEEYEPLLFQLHELSEFAYRRIVGLAREARNGKLEPGGWLSNPAGYYTTNTIYRLLAPLAVFKLMQRRLTLFDLNLDPFFRNQYQIAKMFYHTFAHDFRLAKSKPEINYEPRWTAAKKSEGDAKKYVKQGIPIGLVDNLVESLITLESGESKYSMQRIKSFGEFEKGLNDRKILDEPFKAVEDYLESIVDESRSVMAGT